MSEKKTVGRQPHKLYDSLKFIKYPLSNGRIGAFCEICSVILKNTSVERLKRHRKICSMREETVAATVYKVEPEQIIDNSDVSVDSDANQSIGLKENDKYIHLNSTGSSVDLPFNIIAFLEEYKKHPCLWQGDHPEFTNKLARRKAELQLLTLTKCANVRTQKEQIRSIQGMYDAEIQRIKSARKRGTTYEPKLLWFPVADTFLPSTMNFDLNANSAYKTRPQLGRKPHQLYGSLKFQKYPLSTGRFGALCNICFTTLKNTSVERLLRHRKLCSRKNKSSLGDGLIPAHYSDCSSVGDSSEISINKVSHNSSSTGILKLLQEFKQHPCLWRNDDPDYRNATKRQHAEFKLLTAFGFENITALRDKFRSILELYHNEVQRVNASEQSVTNEIYIPTVDWFSEADAFLRSTFTDEFHAVTLIDDINDDDSAYEQSEDPLGYGFSDPVDSGSSDTNNGQSSNVQDISCVLESFLTKLQERDELHFQRQCQLALESERRADERATVFLNRLEQIFAGNSAQSYPNFRNNSFHPHPENPSNWKSEKMQTNST